MTDTTRVSARSRHLWHDLGEESVILDLEAGTYYGLNVVGSRVWHLIQSPRTLAELRTALLAEFDVDIERCDRDLRALLQSLASRGMIDLEHAA